MPTPYCFSNNKMVSIETYQKSSGNSPAKNGFASANAVVKIAAPLKGITQEYIGVRHDEMEEKKAVHLLQISTLKDENQRHQDHDDLKVMGSQPLTLTQSLTHITNKMAVNSSSSRQGRGDNIGVGGGGYATDDDNGDSDKKTNN